MSSYLRGVETCANQTNVYVSLERKKGMANINQMTIIKFKFP